MNRPVSAVALISTRAPGYLASNVAHANRLRFCGATPDHRGQWGYAAEDSIRCAIGAASPKRVVSFRYRTRHGDSPRQYVELDGALASGRALTVIEIKCSVRSQQHRDGGKQLDRAATLLGAIYAPVRMVLVIVEPPWATLADRNAAEVCGNKRQLRGLPVRRLELGGLEAVEPGEMGVLWLPRGSIELPAWDG